MFTYGYGCINDIHLSYFLCPWIYDFIFYISIHMCIYDSMPGKVSVDDTLISTMLGVAARASSNMKETLKMVPAESTDQTSTRFQNPAT